MKTENAHPLDPVINELEAMDAADPVHWRVMFKKSDRRTFVACLQNFDYRDYTESGFVDSTRYGSEEAANEAQDVSHYYGKDAGI